MNIIYYTKEEFECTDCGAVCELCDCMECEVCGEYKQEVDKCEFSKDFDYICYECLTVLDENEEFCYECEFYTKKLHFIDATQLCDDCLKKELRPTFNFLEGAIY